MSITEEMIRNGMFVNGVKIFRYCFVVALAFPVCKYDSENSLLLIYPCTGKCDQCMIIKESICSQ